MQADQATRNSELGAMTLRLTQSREREAHLETRLSAQNEILEAKQEELQEAQQRIEVLMAYVEIDQSTEGTKESES